LINTRTISFWRCTSSGFPQENVSKQLLRWVMRQICWRNNDGYQHFRTPGVAQAAPAGTESGSLEPLEPPCGKPWSKHLVDSTRYLLKDLQLPPHPVDLHIYPKLRATRRACIGSAQPTMNNHEK
jgi:hypothetical protein